MLRRDFLTLTGLMGGHLLAGRALMGCSDAAGTDGTGTPSSPLFVGGLTTNLREEKRYPARITGTVPRELRGTLYRNGPGIFERDGARINTLVDGDGMIVAWRMTDDGIEFQNRFVRTPALAEEDVAGKFLYDTWTTKRPGGGPRNDAERVGVTVYDWQGKVYALGEASPPWELTPSDLTTLGPRTFGLSDAEASVCAHTHQLAETGEWVLFGQDYSTMSFRLIVLDATNSIVEQWGVPSTNFGPPSYLHDFFCTKNYIVAHMMPIVLNPAAFDRGGVLRDTLEWQNGGAGKFVIFRRRSKAAPTIVELEGAWMWHTVNAHERGANELVLDWIGYDDPWHFLGDDAYWRQVMRGRTQTSGAPGVLRRTVIDLSARTQRTERLSSLPWQEFPVIAPGRVGRSYRYAYHLYTPPGSMLWPAVAKIDMETGRSDTFDFGPGRWALEPIFAPRPGATQEDDGWLLVETVHESAPASLEIFDARKIGDGPIASATIRSHIPMRFHGHWAARSRN